MSAMLDGNSAALARYEREQDQAALRGEQLQRWRDKRRSELECGGDATAILDALPVEDWSDYFGDLIEAALTIGVQRSYNVSQVMSRLIEITLAAEEQRGEWRAL